MELKDVLGATGEASAQKFSLYLPEKDRDGAPVPRHEEWVEAAMTIFAEVNGGATRLPTAQGIWKPQAGPVVREATSVVYSFIRDTGTFEAGLDRLARGLGGVKEARRCGVEDVVAESVSEEVILDLPYVTSR